MSTTDRLRDKINSYIEVLHRVRSEESACKELAAAFSKEDHSYQCTKEAKVLDILRPMIFIHWSKILGKTPEPEWKDVCVEIKRIDKANDHLKSLVFYQQQHDDDRRAAETLAAQMEATDRKAAEALAAEMEEADRNEAQAAEEANLKAAQAWAANVLLDGDQAADFLLFQDDSDAESMASNKRPNEQSPPSPCLLRRRLTRNTRAEMLAWVNDDEV